jgi:hypothetical protein
MRLVSTGMPRCLHIAERPTPCTRKSNHSEGTAEPPVARRGSSRTLLTPTDCCPLRDTQNDQMDAHQGTRLQEFSTRRRHGERGEGGWCADPAATLRSVVHEKTQESPRVCRSSFPQHSRVDTPLIFRCSVWWQTAVMRAVLAEGMKDDPTGEPTPLPSMHLAAAIAAARVLCALRVQSSPVDGPHLPEATRNSHSQCDILVPYEIEQLE